jgi:alpha-tubulin suppressor-like RCC1 family protein
VFKSVTVTFNAASTSPSGATANPTTVCTGGSSNLSVTGGSLGTGAAWKWYTDTTAAALTTMGSPISVSPTANTTYYVRAEGACGKTAFKSVAVGVYPTLSVGSITISTNPVCAGASNVGISISVTGGSNVHYAWTTPHQTVGDVSQFTIATVSAQDPGSYSCVVTDDCHSGATAITKTVTFSVNTASSVPTISPASPTVCSGNPIKLHISGGTLGTGALWKWYTGSCGGTLVGSDSTLTVTPNTNTTYYVRAEGGCLTTDCAFATVVVNTAPTITTQPISQSKWAGDAVSFSIVAGGSTPTYQWYRGTTAVGTNSATCTINSISLNDSGNYTCVVTNSCGTITSNAGNLTVIYVKAAAGSTDHSFFLKSDGTLWACGYNSNGQLGDGSTATHLSPVQIMSGVQNMAGGYAYSLFLKNDGTLWACGSNGSGQLGDGTTNSQSTPIQVMSQVKTMSSYNNFSLILKTDKTLWACGYNGNGQLGLGDSTERHNPVQVMSGVNDISAGWVHSLILKNDTVWTCGNNWYGQLADGTTDFHPTPVPTVISVQKIAAGGYFSLMLKTNGTLMACGSNASGQLGFGDNTDRNYPQEVMTGVKGISAGNEYSLILKSDGTLLACGVNNNGQLGDGTISNRNSPVQVMTNVQSIAACGLHTLIIKTNGTVWACGSNSSGELGDGTTENRLTPVQIKF